jgi:hypothetical protein
MQCFVLFLRWRVFCAIFITILCAQAALRAQTAKAALSGLVKDASGAVLQGARVDLEPAVQPATTNGPGRISSFRS